MDRKVPLLLCTKTLAMRATGNIVFEEGVYYTGRQLPNGWELNNDEGRDHTVTYEGPGVGDIGWANYFRLVGLVSL